MTLYCDFCGRRWITQWPELWPYRYQDKLFCSENCKICDSTLTKLGKGRKKLMARLKNDGTPAKKPGRKPKMITDPDVESKIPEEPMEIETEEPETMEVEPEQPKKAVPLNYDGYTVRCIEGQYGKFYWDYEYNRLDWTSPEGEEVSLSPEGWRTFCTEVMPKVMAILGVPGNV